MTQEINHLLEPYRSNIELAPIEYQKTVVTKQQKTAVATEQKRKVISTDIPKRSPFIEYQTITDNSVKKDKDSFKWPSTDATESNKNTNIEGSFRLETDLRKLGYQITGLSRQHRWNILKTKAIPKLPLREIANTIANNVRLRKAQIGGKEKFAYAIAEWEYDLNRLKKEYYRSDFTWPKF